MQLALSYPWLLSLMGLPAILAAVPLLLQKIEMRALNSLFAIGDDADKKAIKEIVKTLVQWAEEKYREGPIKFDAVDSIVAYALPFIGAEQREQLIEAAVKDLDAGAKQSVQ
jgi:hypothetical protein